MDSAVGKTDVGRDLEDELSQGLQLQEDEKYEMELNIAKERGDKVAEGRASGKLGKYYYSIGQFNRAVQHLEITLNIAKQVGDKIGELEAYGSLGSCYHRLGQYSKAMHHQEMQLNMAKEIGDRKVEGNAHCNIGSCHYSVGRYDKAIQHYETQLSIAKEIGDKKGEGTVYGNLGNCYSSLGQYEKAIHHNEMHLNIAKQIGDKAGEGRAYGNLGNCYHRLGQHEKAMGNQKMHLNITKQTGDKAGEGRACGNLGNCLYALGQYDEAIRHYEMHLKITQQIGDKPGEGRAYSGLGNCYYSLGQFDKAILHQEKDLNITRELGDKAGQARTCRNLGILYHDLAQYDKTEYKLRESLRCYEELFKNVPKQDQFKLSIRDIFITVYNLLISSLLYQNKTEQALVMAERSRARALAVLMFTSYSTECAEVAEANALDLRDIQEVVKAIGSTVLFLSCGIRRGICMWIIQPNGDVEIMTSGIGRGSVEMVDFDPAEVEKELKSLINRARKLQGLDSTADCEDRSLSFLYAKEENEPAKEKIGSYTKSDDSEDKGVSEPSESCAGPSSSPTAQNEQAQVREPLVSQGISRHQAFVEEKVKETKKSYETNALTELYNLILGPVRQSIEGSQLVVIADGQLNLVPFAALMDANGYTVSESLKVRLIPSLATAKMIMGRLQEPGGQARPLIVGDPDALAVGAPRLPCAREEARMIADLFGVQALTGREATRESFLQNLENANLIHIAAHGDMKRGEIVLAPSPDIDREKVKKRDCMLVMSDLEQKRLKAKLVVLSCCHSACGDVRADGVIGIARAFLGAGARSVLVALWAIDDKATMYFMKTFYEHLKQGDRANESLDKAIKAMRGTEQFKQPYYWAPFVLIGDNVALF